MRRLFVHDLTPEETRLFAHWMILIECSHRNKSPDAIEVVMANVTELAAKVRARKEAQRAA